MIIDKNLIAALSASVIRSKPFSGINEKNIQKALEALGVENLDRVSEIEAILIALDGKVNTIENLPKLLPSAYLINNGEIDDRFVQSRADQKGAYNKFGNSITLNSTEYTFEYDPLTKEPLGYIGEVAATYIPLNSEDFAGWGFADTGGGFGGNTIAPDGSNTATLWTGPTTTGYYSFAQKTGTADASGQATFTMWVKRISGAGNISLVISDVSSVTNSGGFLDVTSEWKKFNFTSVTLTNTGNIGVGVDNTTPGDVFAFWHPTLTLGTISDVSYWPTVGSDFSRIEDNLTLNLTSYNDVVNLNGFTMVCRADVGPSTRTRAIFEISDGTANNRLTLLVNTSGVNLIQDVGGVTESIIIIPNNPGTNVFAISYDGTNIRMAATGQTCLSDTGVANNALNKLSVGTLFSAGFELSGRIDKLIPYSRACTPIELEALVKLYT